MQPLYESGDRLALNRTVVGPEKQMVGSACCARAASGQAAAMPPRRVMNSRRFIRSPNLPPTIGWMVPHVFRNAANRRPEQAKKPRVGGAELQEPAKVWLVSAAVVLAM